MALISKNRSGYDQPREGRQEFPWLLAIFATLAAICIAVGTIKGIGRSFTIGFWYAVLTAATEWTLAFTVFSLIIFLAFGWRTGLLRCLTRFVTNWKWSEVVKWWNWEVSSPLRKNSYNDVPAAIILLVSGVVVLTQIGHFFITGQLLFTNKDGNDYINWLGGATILFTSLWMIWLEKKS